MFQIIKEICNNSEIGKPMGGVKKGNRIINVKSHMIIYKIVNEKNYRPNFTSKNRY
ncbi:MAG: type II toxin-antitoxin system RelE/ParE family toxin [Saprospiraceae bacterium]|nr:type II toxin-antitoxin system RelE/ParE family toxin [Saprospiraceae bacterium]